MTHDTRHAICHKLYTDWILGSEFYPTKNHYLWPFSFKEWCNSQENNGFYSDSALNSFNLHNKPPCLHPFTSNAPKQITKNITTKQQEVNLQQTAYVHGKILPHWKEILHG